ncbi:uncharacterized protein LOC128331484 isoform X2 [Hemicordylus capensis]|uniref:uncharacterized protein LOC128331484 isoform X2 n=1 Tax=Hemicordylus capensis TaxID=884348 RepID=UPI0023035CC3|nr:uncharacterized protein LOC128331484 isoform X2 [Hemicordylus capensis]
MKVFSMTPKQDIYTRGESIDLTCSASAASPSAATPKSSTIFQDAPGNEAARGLADVPRRPTFSALQPTSSHPADHSPTSPEDPQDTMKSRGSQSPPSQTPFRELKPHSAKPHGIPTTGLSSSQSTLPGSTSTSTNSQNGKEPDPLLLPLAVGCGGGGALVLLAALVCLYKRKQKASSRISSRTYWNSFKSQRSTKKRRCQDPIGIAITLQERDEPSESMGQDWGILPKSKIRAPKVGGPSKEKKREEDADSGAVFEFPEMDPNYTLLGFPCSTFYWDENEGSTVEAHLSQQDI